MTDDEKELLRLVNLRCDSLAYFVFEILQALDEHQLYGHQGPGSLLLNFTRTNNELVEKLNPVVERLNAAKQEEEA